MEGKQRNSKEARVCYLITSYPVRHTESNLTLSHKHTHTHTHIKKQYLTRITPKPRLAKYPSLLQAGCISGGAVQMGLEPVRTPIDDDTLHPVRTRVMQYDSILRDLRGIPPRAHWKRRMRRIWGEANERECRVGYGKLFHYDTRLLTSIAVHEIFINIREKEMHEKEYIFFPISIQFKDFR